MKTPCLLAVVILGLSASLPAKAAPTRDQCVDAYERAQAEQKEGKFARARTDFAVCAEDACPKLVNKDCKSAIEEMKTSFPSVVLGSGGQSDVRVSIDGAASRDIPSSAIELDPGEHVFRFELADGTRSEKHVTLSAGQRDVSVVPDFPSPDKTPPPAQPEPRAPKEASNAPGTAVIVLGAVALVGAGGFVGFGLAGKSKQSDLDACKPDCSPDDVHDMRRKYLFADISLGVALAAGGIGAYLYFSRDKTSERAVWVRPSAGPNLTQLELGARF